MSAIFDRCLFSVSSTKLDENLRFALKVPGLPKEDYEYRGVTSSTNTYYQIFFKEQSVYFTSQEQINNWICEKRLFLLKKNHHTCCARCL